jgi:hypothetical protein
MMIAIGIILAIFVILFMGAGLFSLFIWLPRHIYLSRKRSAGLQQEIELAERRKKVGLV